MAKFNSYNVSSGNNTRLYYLTPFNLTYAAAPAAVSFWMYHDTGYSTPPNDRIQVQVSTNGGSGWIDVGTAVPRYSTAPPVGPSTPSTCRPTSARPASWWGFLAISQLRQQHVHRFNRHPRGRPRSLVRGQHLDGCLCVGRRGRRRRVCRSGRNPHHHHQPDQRGGCRRSRRQCHPHVANHRCHGGGRDGRVRRHRRGRHGGGADGVQRPAGGGHPLRHGHPVPGGSSGHRGELDRGLHPPGRPTPAAGGRIHGELRRRRCAGVPGQLGRDRCGPDGRKLDHL